MKRILLLLPLLLASMTIAKADDYSVDFTAVSDDGITFGYHIESVTYFTVSVVSVDYGKKSRSTKIVIPDTVEYNSRMFYVNSVKRARGVKSIAFHKKKGIYSGAFDTGVNIYIPDLDFWKNLTIINRSYETFSYNSEGPYYRILSGIPCNLYVNEQPLKDLVIPDTWTEVPASLFSECMNIETVTFPSSVTAIEEAAFRNCPNLKSVKFSNSLKRISFFAFEGCKSLESVAIPDFVSSVRFHAFAGCTSMKHVTLGNSMTEVPLDCFENCTSLESVEFSNSIKLIDSEAFKYCVSLASIDIPNSVTWIGALVFYGCKGLTSITFGEGIKEIPTSVIAGWESIKSITCKSQTPPKVSQDNNHLSNKVLLDAVLYVPKGTTEAYGNSFFWRSFLNVSTIGGTPDDIHYKVSVIAGKGGCVASDGQSVSDGQMLVRYDKDAGVVLTITPDKGYRISAVKVNGTDVTKDVKDGKYTLESVDEDTSITVAFEAMVYERHDLNEDGEVNTADVVDIYNRIIYGKDYDE